jgi:quercetin dioxygenase-like cupin family protein
MYYQQKYRGALGARAFAALLALGLAGAPASAQDAVSEQAVARKADDRSLDWGPCPPFMPAGCALAVLHGDPSKPNADLFFRVPAGARLPVHWHTSAERMVLVSGELRVTYEGQEPVVLMPGAYAYGPPRRPHGGDCLSATPCTLFIAFEEPVDAVAGKDGHGH